MLDHLDDPAPPALDESFYGRVVRTARLRRVRHRAAATGAGLTLCAAGVVTFVRTQADQLERVRVDGLTPATAPATVPTVSRAPVAAAPHTAAPAAPLTAPVNILLVGVDARAEGGSSRSDTIVVVRLDPSAGSVRVLSVPRDLYVEVSDGYQGRINALAEDPSQLARAISDELGIDLQHYIEIDFPGFVELVDLAGGVTVPFDRPMRDSHSGFLVEEPGCRTLDGEAALAYARARHLQVFDSVSQTWETDATSDFGRIARQQDFMSRLYRQVLTADYGPIDELRLLTDIADDLTVDTGLSVSGLRRLFATAQAIGPEAFQSYDLAGAVRIAEIGGAAVLVPEPDAVADVVQRFLTAEPTSPSAPISTDAVVPPPARSCP